jgi:hypothetical protein
MTQMKSNDMEQSVASSGKNNSWLELIAEQVASLRFGVVQIVVHDSRVVQIERTEKVRLDQKES